MESLGLSKTCPRCGEWGLKTWDELTDEEQFLIERLPASADYTSKERERHLFCPRCWFEETEPKPNLA